MADSGNGKRDLATTLVVVLLLTLVGAGVGFAVGILLRGNTEPEATLQEKGESPEAEQASAGAEDDPRPEDDAKTATEETPAEGLKIIPLPPVLTGLAEPKGKWIRLEGSIIAAPAGDVSPELLAERSGEQIMTYLRSVKLSQIEGPSGILGLRDDLNETLRALSNGEVHAVLIHGLVVE